MNPKLSVEIGADIKGMEAALKKADTLLKQHQRNYKGVQSAISQNTQKSQQLERSISQLNNKFKQGQVSEQQFSKETDRLSRELQQVNKSTSNYQRELRRLDREMDRVAQSTANYSKNAGRVNSASGKAAAGMGKMGKTASANATPAMISFSQTVQDAPYGIQGVANNIQQLTMQMGYLSKSAGGAKGALKAMGATLMGPTGILLGVSLITTALVSYGDEIMAAMQGTNKLSDATKEFNGNAQTELQTLNALLGVARNEANSKKQRSEAIDQINDKYGEYFSNLDLERINTAKVREEVDNLTNSLLAQAKVKGAQAVIEEKARKLAEQAMEANEYAQRESGKLVSEEIRGLKSKMTAYKQSLEVMKQQQAAGQDVSQGIAEMESKIGDLKSTLSDTEGLRKNVISDYIKEQTSEAEQDIKEFSTVLQNAMADSFTFAPEYGDKGKDKDGLNVPVELDLPSNMMDAGELEGLQKMLDENAQKLKLPDALGAASLDSRMNQAEQELFSNSLDGWDAYNEDLKERAKEQQQIANMISGAISGMVSSMVNDLMEGQFKVEDLVKQIGMSLLNIAIGAATGGLGNIITGALGFAGGGIAEPKGFTNGGLIGGSSFSGDKLWARVNSGEMVLNKDQQKNLYGQLNAPRMVSMGGSQDIKLSGDFRIEGEHLRAVLDRTDRSRGRIG